MLPQARPDPTGRPSDRGARRLIRTSLLAVAGILAVAGTASAVHGGVAIDGLDPQVFQPGDAIRIDFTEPKASPTDPVYLSTDLVVQAPTVDGTELAFDASAADGGSSGTDNWTLASGSDDTLRYSWTGSGTPSPPPALTVPIDSGLPAIEGDAIWQVDFCVRSNGVQHCPSGHGDAASNVYDNKAPETSIAVEDPRDNTASPLYQQATVRLEATDEGSGVAETRYRVNRGLARTYTGPISLDEPGLYTVEYRAEDHAGNHESIKETTYVVVDGLAFSAVSQQARAGETFTLVVRFAEDVTTSSTTGVPGANYPIRLDLAKGPEGMDATVADAKNSAATFDVDFETVGSYVFEADHDHLPSVTSPPIQVQPGPLTRLEVTPSSTTVPAGGSVSFQADGFDAYNNTVAVDPAWAASCGRITQQGQFIASTSPGTCTVVASQGPIDGAAEVQVEGSTSSDGDGAQQTSGSSPAVGDLSSSTHPTGVWVDTDRVDLSWSAPAGDVAGYSYAVAEGAVDPPDDVRTGSTSTTVSVPDEGNWTVSVEPVFADGSTGSVAAYGPILVDTGPPVPPGRVTAEATEQGVTVTWDAPRDDGASPVSSYLVTRKGPRDDGYEAVSEGTVEQARFEDAAVQPGATYRYRVAAVDAAGNQGPPAKAAEATVPEDAETTPVATDDGNVSLAGLYDALGIDAGDAELVDADGDGTPDGLAGDPRLRVARTATVGGQPTLLVSLGQSRPKALVVASTGQARPLDHVEGTVGGQKLTDSGTIVTAQVPSYDGWALVTLGDPLADVDLKKIVDGDGQTLDAGRHWRGDGTVTVLGDGAEMYVLQYAKTDRSGGASAAPATPGPSVVLVAAGAAAALLLRRRWAAP